MAEQTWPLQAWIGEATTRYLTDPNFHSRVQLTCQLTQGVADKEGVQLSAQTIAAMVQVASLALLVAEADIDFEVFWTPEEVEESMQYNAEALGFKLGKE